MFSTRGDVKAKVRSLLDDVQGSYLDDAFLDPLIQQEYEAAASELAGTLSPFDEMVVEVPGVTAGTSDLSAYQAAGKPLETLVNPERIDWKVAGQPSWFYRKLRGPMDMLPDTRPDQCPIGWEWRAEIIYITPATADVDLRVRGEFGVPILRSDDDQLTLHKRIGYAIGYRVAALAAAVRGNSEWVKNYGDQAIVAMDEIEAQLVRADQGKVRRVGRMTRCNRTRGRYSSNY